MLDRVTDRLSVGYGSELNIYTFNAFGQEMLQEFATEIGLSSNLRLIGDIGKVVLLRDHIDELGLDYFAPVSSPEGQLDSIGSYFSKLKQQLVKPVNYINYSSKLASESPEEDLDKQRHQELAVAFEAYQKIMRLSNLIDYDDQIYLLIELLEQRPNIKKLLTDRYKYILVDEFQDTNPMQSKLIDLLLGESQNVMAVGDDDQSIYGWRGATLANILNFTEQHPQTHQVTLVDNYRSGQPILDIAYKLIQNNNPNRLEAINNLDKKLLSHSEIASTPQVERFDTLDGELDWIARDIATRIENGDAPESIAVLTRRNASAKRVSEMLSFHGIDHVLAGVSSDMYRHPTVANMLTGLKAIIDPADNTALFHLLTGPLLNQQPHRVGELAATARRKHHSLWEIIQTDGDLAGAVKMIIGWRSVAHEKTVSELAYQMLDESGLKDTLYEAAETDSLAANAVKALGHWFETMREFQAVSSIATAVVYLENLDTLMASGETLDESSFSTNLPVVMSVHKAKGLEWETVYIADCSEYSFPLKNSRTSLVVPEELSISSKADDHMAEERRLMYVACTRAKSNLILTHSDTHTGTTQRKPSRFLVEMFGEDTIIGNTLQDQPKANLSPISRPALPESAPALPNTMKAGDKLLLSASQLNDYLRCPLDFYYRHVLNVPSEPNASSAVGTLFHALLQDINQAKMNQSDIPTLERLLQRIEEDWPDEGYLSAEQRERALRHAKLALKDTYARILDQPVPLASEEPFRVSVPGSNVILKGRIDAVLQDGEEVEIVDYKTSTSATDPKKAKQSATSSKQLEMYALAWREKHGSMPSKLSLDFVQTNQVGSVAKRESTIDKLCESISKAGEAILRGEFPLGATHKYCRHPHDDN